MKEALTLALEALNHLQPTALTSFYTIGDRDKAITAIKEALAQPEQDDRRLQTAMRQWEDWKIYALELQKKLVKYEGGSPMILNTQPKERNFCPRCGKRLGLDSIHTCTPPIAAGPKAFYGFPKGSVSTSNAGGKCVTAGETAPIDPNQWAFDRGLESS